MDFLGKRRSLPCRTACLMSLSAGVVLGSVAGFAPLAMADSGIAPWDEGVPASVITKETPEERKARYEAWEARNQKAMEEEMAREAEIRRQIEEREAAEEAAQNAPEDLTGVTLAPKSVGRLLYCEQVTVLPGGHGTVTLRIAWQPMDYMFKSYDLDDPANLPPRKAGDRISFGRSRSMDPLDDSVMAGGTTSSSPDSEGELHRLETLLNKAEMYSIKEARAGKKPGKGGSYTVTLKYEKKTVTIASEQKLNPAQKKALKELRDIFQKKQMEQEESSHFHGH